MDKRKPFMGRVISAIDTFDYSNIPCLSIQEIQIYTRVNLIMGYILPGANKEHGKSLAFKALQGKSWLNSGLNEQRVFEE
jgi:hypothetical protein